MVTLFRQRRTSLLAAPGWANRRPTCRQGAADNPPRPWRRNGTGAVPEAMQNEGQFGQGASEESKKKPPAFGRRLFFFLRFIYSPAKQNSPYLRHAARNADVLKIVAGAKVPRENREFGLQGCPNPKVWLQRPRHDAGLRSQEARRQHGPPTPPATGLPPTLKRLGDGVRAFGRPRVTSGNPAGGRGRSPTASGGFWRLPLVR